MASKSFRLDSRSGFLSAACFIVITRGLVLGTIGLGTRPWFWGVLRHAKYLLQLLIHGFLLLLSRLLFRRPFFRNLFFFNRKSYCKLFVPYESSFWVLVGVSARLCVRWNSRERMVRFVFLGLLS